MKRPDLSASDPWPGTGVELDLSLSRCALVLVDMQRGYLDPANMRGRWMRDHHPLSHSYFFGRMGTIVPNLSRMLAHWRALHLPVVHVAFGWTKPDRSDMPLAAHRGDPPWADGSEPLEEFMFGGHEHRIIEELTPISGETVFNKTSHSAFSTTPMEAWLAAEKVRRLVVGGWATNACVEMTARDAADRGFDTFLVEDACAGFTADTHEGALRNFSRLYGGVVATQEVLKAPTVDC